MRFIKQEESNTYIGQGNTNSPIGVRDKLMTRQLLIDGKIGSGDIAVFTAMCMCWSGYLSTHISMMDSLKCRELTGKAIVSHTVGGLCAGIVAHWIFVLVSLI